MHNFMRSFSVKLKVLYFKLFTLHMKSLHINKWFLKRTPIIKRPLSENMTILLFSKGVYPNSR